LFKKKTIENQLTDIYSETEKRACYWILKFELEQHNSLGTKFMKVIELPVAVVACQPAWLSLQMEAENWRTSMAVA
jgi:hypothetical protein